MARWWGPANFTNSACEMDVRPGGAYRIVMRSPEGVEYPIRGIFLEVARPERLVMTLDTSGHPTEWHDLVNPNRGDPRRDAEDGNDRGLVAKPGSSRRAPGEGVNVGPGTADAASGRSPFVCSTEKAS